MWTFTDARDGAVIDEAAWTDPRRIEVADLLYDLGFGGLGLRGLLAGDEVRFVEVEPVPGAVVESATTDVDGPEFVSDGGWRVIRGADLDLVMGPQAAEIREVVARTPDELPERYEDLAGRVDPAALDAARDALNAAEIDGYWWECEVSCVSGYERIALAARDLIGSTREWTQEAYSELVHPWRTVFGSPL